MRVADHRLCDDSGAPVRFQQTPNIGAKLSGPRLIVMHYTAGRGAQQSADWLCNRKAKASAHLVIGADGGIIQLAGFDRVTWHAGRSEWELDGKLVTGINAHSIGIELDNPGPLQKTAAGWATYFGKRWPAADVVIDRHKHAAPGSAPRGWAAYPEAQILAAYVACEALIDAYPTLQDVVGHDDVAPGRKTDPGPAFPMESFRAWLFGRADDSEVVDGERAAL